MSPVTYPCPLCGHPSADRVHASAIPHPREFFHCGICRLIFVPAAFFLTAEQERARYAEHNNDSTDPRYREFLNQAFLPLRKRLTAGARGLDYGCGPGPALAQMFEEAGHPMALYDPFFVNDQSALEGTYDFITCTEAAEHFHRPLREFERLHHLLKPGGYLTLLTGIWWEEMRFGDWYYQRDPTHVIFFHQATFEWLAKHFGWKLFYEARNVVTFQRA